MYDLFLISWRSWLSSTSVPIKTKTQTVSRPNLLTCWLTNFHSTVRFFVQTFFRLRPWTCQDLSRFLTIFRGLDQYFITQTKKYQYFYLTSLNSTQSWPKLFQPRLRPTCSKLLRRLLLSVSVGTLIFLTKTIYKAFKSCSCNSGQRGSTC